MNESISLQAKQGYVTGPSLFDADYDQRQIDNQPPSNLISLNRNDVLQILDSMLLEDKTILSDEARYQEGNRLYLLIVPLISYHSRHIVGMSPELARSFVLQALRQSGSHLGAESSFDKLFLRLSSHSQPSPVNSNTKFRPCCQLISYRLLKDAGYGFYEKIQWSVMKKRLTKIMTKLLSRTDRNSL